MSEVERRNIDKDIAFHGAPTLLGVKCANLISLMYAIFVFPFQKCKFKFTSILTQIYVIVNTNLHETLDFLMSLVVNLC